VQTSQRSDARSSASTYNFSLKRRRVTAGCGRSDRQSTTTCGAVLESERHHLTPLKDASDQIVRAQITAVALATIAIIANLLYFAPVI
jgi:hypothetical protein